jgi:hypothetical protein
MSIARLALILAIAATLHGSDARREQHPACPTTLSTFLTMAAGQDDPPDKRERFEFRDCPGRGIQLQAFERSHASPTLVSEVFSFPLFLVQSHNVLAFQSPGGSTDEVYIYAFQKGRPRLIAKTASKAQMQVRMNGNGAAVIEVSDITYERTEQGVTYEGSGSGRIAFRRYVVPIEVR